MPTLTGDEPISASNIKEAMGSVVAYAGVVYEGDVTLNQGSPSATLQLSRSVEGLSRVDIEYEYEGRTTTRAVATAYAPLDATFTLPFIPNGYRDSSSSTPYLNVSFSGATATANVMAGSGLGLAWAKVKRIFGYV